MPSIHRLPHPVDITLFASAARAVAQTYTSSAQTNDSALGLILTVVTTAETDTAEITPLLQYSYDAGTTWVTFWTAAAAITTLTTSTYLVYPGILATADGSYTESLNAPLPRLWRLGMTHADTDSMTYAAYAQLL